MKEVATILAVATACGCEDKQTVAPNNNDEIPIACVLSALTKEQRDREDVLLKEHLISFREMKEGDEGYSFRYEPDVALFGRMAELVALEHRCRPFLDFELEWARGKTDPWLHIRGGARVKEFVKDTFAPKTK